MTYKEKIIEFINTKKALVSLYTTTKYIDHKDIKEIESWSEEECRLIYKHMENYITISFNMPINTKIEDSITCPWCVYNAHIKKSDNYIAYNYCDECGYGKRNGICDKSGSKYKQIVDEGVFALIRKEDYFNIINNIKKIK